MTAACDEFYLLLPSFFTDQPTHHPQNRKLSPLLGTPQSLGGGVDSSSVVGVGGMPPTVGISPTATAAAALTDNYPSLAANYAPGGINQKYHPLFDHGMCKWPGCEMLFDDFPLFTKYVPLFDFSPTSLSLPHVLCPLLHPLYTGI